jgi:hypothetical protein
MGKTEPFYLGRLLDSQSGQVSDRPLLYDPADLTTHAVVVGMTGSGKTGLCIDLLEEAALQGLPALMIDPKGDITNALLHFPEQAPQDFAPWVNPDQARRAGLSVEAAVQEAAAAWQKGLADWGLAPERLRALANAAAFAVYTPGSDAGIPVSILASLQCPAIPWEGNRELLREKISGTVTALLGLVGLPDIDPVRSREHILLANIFEHAWSQGQDLDLGELILRTQTPPFPKLGVFDVNVFFPEKERFALAMLLNNILAAPAFQSWIEGQPLDLPALLYAPDGRPRHSVFYIAHLSEAERMFFVTLLLSALESWMRAQPGSPALRALVYFDELYGYLPPVSNPPSKQPLLRLLKQARAFGVGLVLVTQNPADIDYKGLSNAGTWFIGKLQTEQDKQRLLDGLESAAALTSAAGQRAKYEKLISTLGKRVFLMRNIHAAPGEGDLALFQTRWSMNYLAGPLTRNQIPALNRLARASSEAKPKRQAAGAPAGIIGTGATQPVSVTPVSSAGDRSPLPAGRNSPETALPGPAGARGQSEAAIPGYTWVRPTVAGGIREVFLPNDLSFTGSFKAANRPFPEEAFSQGLVYRPALVAQALVRFLKRAYDLDYQLQRAVLVSAPDRRGVVRWEQFGMEPLDPQRLESEPGPQARFAALEAPLTDTRALAALQKDFVDWVYRSAQLTLRVNPALKLYGGPEDTAAEFRARCAEAARAERDAEAAKVSEQYAKKQQALLEKIAREERELRGDEVELDHRKWEERGSWAETAAGLFGLGRKRSVTSSLTKRRLTEQARAEVDESLEALAEMKKQLAALEKEKATALEEVSRRWGQVANQVSEETITPLKKDVLLDFFGVGWVPFYLVKIQDELVELPGFNGLAG